jgi:hypothetical protein
MGDNNMFMGSSTYQNLQRSVADTRKYLQSLQNKQADTSENQTLNLATGQPANISLANLGATNASPFVSLGSGFPLSTNLPTSAIQRSNGRGRPMIQLQQQQMAQAALAGQMSQIMQVLQNMAVMLERYNAQVMALAQAVDNQNNDAANLPGNNFPPPPPPPMSLEDLLNQFLQQFQANQTPQSNPALGLLQDALKVSDAEKTDAANKNPDGDDFAVSQADLDNLKAKIADKTITPQQLGAAFQKQFLQGDLNTTDEMAVFFGKAVDQGVLPATELLKPSFLQALPEDRRFALSQGLANAGLRLEDGTFNRQLAGWMLNNVESGNPVTQSFARDLVKGTYNAWKDDFATPEGQTVKAFLSDWLRVKFQPNSNALAPDSEQPFPMADTAATPEEAPAAEASTEPAETDTPSETTAATPTTPATTPTTGTTTTAPASTATNNNTTTNNTTTNNTTTTAATTTNTTSTTATPANGTAALQAQTQQALDDAAAQQQAEEQAQAERNRNATV